MYKVMITGANRGIGFALVEEYLDKGWIVYACSRHKSEQNAQFNHLARPENLIQIYMDINDLGSIHNALNIIGDEPIDVLINNASIWHYESNGIENIAFEEWEHTFKTNAISQLQIAQTFLKNILSSHQKKIINISSRIGSVSECDITVSYFYSASKAALNCFTKCLSLDLKKYNAIVISLHPGWVKTKMGGENAPLSTQESASAIYRVIDGLVEKDSGYFFDYKGGVLQW